MKGFTRKGQLSNTSDTGRASRRAYSKPRLESLGLVKEMTLAGTGQASESASTQARCDSPSFRVNPQCNVP